MSLRKALNLIFRWLTHDLMGEWSQDLFLSYCNYFLKPELDNGEKNRCFFSLLSLVRWCNLTQNFSVVLVQPPPLVEPSSQTLGWTSHLGWELTLEAYGRSDGTTLAFFHDSHRFISRVFNRQISMGKFAPSTSWSCMIKVQASGRGTPNNCC